MCDEYQYLIKCHVFNHERLQYLHKYHLTCIKNELLQSKHAPTVRLLSVVWVPKITIDNFIIIRTMAITCTNLSINYAFLRI